MYIDFKKIVRVFLLLTAGAAVGISILLVVQRSKTPKQIVTVTGTAELDAETDQATINIQVKATGLTLAAAETANKNDVASLKKILAELGIPESRINMSSYTQSYREGMAIPDVRPQPVSTAPTAITNLNVILTPITDIEGVLESISANPNTQITNTYYSLNNRKGWESKAKEAALEDARTQIESVAKINGLRVGKLTSLQDMNDPQNYPMPVYERKTMSPGSTSIDEPIDTGVMEDNAYYGEQTVKITAAFKARYELY